MQAFENIQSFELFLQMVSKLPALQTLQVQDLNLGDAKIGVLASIEGFKL